MVGKANPACGFLAKARTLSLEFENPNGVEDAMRHMMIKTRKKLHAIYIKDLLQMLYDRDMGTPEVFIFRRSCAKMQKERLEKSYE